MGGWRFGPRGRMWDWYPRGWVPPRLGVGGGGGVVREFRWWKCWEEVGLTPILWKRVPEAAREGLGPEAVPTWRERVSETDTCFVCSWSKILPGTKSNLRKLFLHTSGKEDWANQTCRWACTRVPKAVPQWLAIISMVCNVSSDKSVPNGSDEVSLREECRATSMCAKELETQPRLAVALYARDSNSSVRLHSTLG